jgi:hypothetical protein
MKRIKQILKFFKNELVHYIQGIAGYRKFNNKFRNSKSKKGYLIGTVTNGNLGDQAITYNQIKVLNELKDYEIREITNDEYWGARKYLRKTITPSDIICIQGKKNRELTESMSISHLIEDVRVSIRHISNHNVSFCDLIIDSAQDTSLEVLLVNSFGIGS